MEEFYAVCRVSQWGTRQRLCLPCAAVGHTGNLNGRRCCQPEGQPRHKANSVVCYVPVAGTRQTLTTVARPDGRRTRHARAEDLPCAWDKAHDEYNGLPCAAPGHTAK